MASTALAAEKERLASHYGDLLKQFSALEQTLCEFATPADAQDIAAKVFPTTRRLLENQLQSLDSNPLFAPLQMKASDLDTLVPESDKLVNIPSSTFAIVKHTLKDHTKYWERVREMSGPQNVDNVAKKCADAGAFNHTFIPTTDKNVVIGLWEIRNKNAAHLQQFLDELVGADVVENSVFWIDAGKSQNLPESFSVPAIEPPNPSTHFFIVHSHLKRPTEFTLARLNTITDETKRTEYLEACDRAGCCNHSLYPSHTRSDVFSLWETKREVSKADLVRFLQAHLVTPAWGECSVFVVDNQASMGLPATAFPSN